MHSRLWRQNLVHLWFKVLSLVLACDLDSFGLFCTPLPFALCELWALPGTLHASRDYLYALPDLQILRTWL